MSLRISQPNGTFELDETLMSSLMSNSLETNFTDITDFRTKVDRNLLEKMLDGSDTSVESAQDFFARASSTSGAIISFPQMWKLQVMPRKDPEVRIIGTTSQVSSARKLIMDVMDPHRNRVLIKIDVSFSDHSFIIGKGGKRIQSIMDVTKTQIHFPDENLINDEMKSNVVTITSDSLRKADEARQVIRQSLPLTIGFQISLRVDKVCALNSRHPMIEYYQRRFNVIVSFKCLEATLDYVVVCVQLRGSRLHFDNLYEATTTLYTLFNTSNLGINLKIFEIHIEIAPRHHTFVMGVNNDNIRSIHNRTGAIVSFPDVEVNAKDLASLNASRVTIKGVGIESTFMAWLQLLDCLPVVLLFDIKEEEVNPQVINSLMANQLLTIKICPKVNSDKRNLLLKTQERHTNLLFEARKLLLKIEEQPICSLQETPSQNQSHKQSKAMPYIPHEVLNSEPEVLRSDRH